MTCVIVEGPDGAGKTTLIQRLRERMPNAVFTHHGSYAGERQIAQHYLRSMARAKTVSDHTGRPVIMDRSWIAEPIYGRAMRDGANRIAVAERRMLERVALGVGAVVVYCLPNYETCHRAWASRREQEYLDTEAKLYQVWRGYADLAFDFHPAIPSLTYNYESDNVSELFDLLNLLLIRGANLGPGIGSLRGSHDSPRGPYLLVGDEVSARGHVGYPFVSLHRGGCSWWLAERLEQAGVSEGRLYWINQAEVDADVVRADHELVFGRGPFGKVIALGRKASDWCRRAGLEHAECYHPQFWKRFYFNRPYDMVKELMT